MSDDQADGCLSSTIQETGRACSSDARQATSSKRATPTSTLPSITLHEALTARRTLLAKGRREVDSRAVVRTAVAQRELVDEAKRKTTTARRGGGAQNSKADDR